MEEKLSDLTTTIEELSKNVTIVNNKIDYVWNFVQEEFFKNKTVENNDFNQNRDADPLKYNIIKLNLNSVTKVIESWEGFDSAKDAAAYCKVKPITVINLANHSFKIKDWTTFTFMSVQEFVGNYYNKQQNILDKELFE